MKIKLSTVPGLFTSTKGVLVETDSIESVTDKGDYRCVVLHNGKEHNVSESVDAIDKLINPPKLVPPVLPSPAPPTNTGTLPPTT